MPADAPSRRTSGTTAPERVQRTTTTPDITAPSSRRAINRFRAQAFIFGAPWFIAFTWQAAVHNLFWNGFMTTGIFTFVFFGLASPMEHVPPERLLKWTAFATVFHFVTYLTSSILISASILLLYKGAIWYSFAWLFVWFVVSAYAFLIAASWLVGIGPQDEDDINISSWPAWVKDLLPHGIATMIKDEYTRHPEPAVQVRGTEGPRDPSSRA
ncbi:hypothetical protein CkaCkLH20_09495 [Colletotrichum karsti]|uniref:Uncharacterized protein n=1 Tax=Colletotrichum karsti TaxID=1095194 RepID=A0A9P6LHV8_9PEZI|nr:uncharacterized protein CkaCkLH20_09495 [Colletotrichum karsti]KAF9872985.1 hypothetical protein CkaCkLH20_09495 [Colletotrichum karsti]